MKYFSLGLAMTATLCLAGSPSYEGVKVRTSDLRKEHEDKRDSDGHVVAYIETIYRGNERALSTVTIARKTKYGLRAVRAYYVGGKEVLDELDYDDGRPQMVRLYKDNMLCDEFRRRPDGSVEPVGGEELAKLKAQQQELLKALKL